MTCGTELPDSANYCLGCGTPQRAEAEARYERCKIEWRDLGGWKYEYFAEALGPHGFYEAAKSDVFRHKPSDGPSDKNEAPLREFVRRLAEDGWDAEKQGDRWWSYEFRRRARP